MSRTMFFAGMACGLILILAPSGFTQTGTIPSLLGSWEFSLKPSQMTGAATTLVPGLATFTGDGSVIETDSSEVVPGQIVPDGYATPGHGIWQPGPVFGSLFVRFTSLVVNSDGSLRAKKITTLTVKLRASGNQFSGGYSFQLVDPTGHAITFGSGTVTGQRMVHPLLP